MKGNHSQTKDKEEKETSKADTGREQSKGDRGKYSNNNQGVRVEEYHDPWTDNEIQEFLKELDSFIQQYNPTQ